MTTSVAVVVVFSTLANGRFCIATQMNVRDQLLTTAKFTENLLRLKGFLN
jgi:hypothetical protein